MNKAALREYSKLMQKKEKAKAKELARQQQIQEQQAEDKPEESVNELAVDLAKTTKLVFFRQYNTYQALLEVHPKDDINSDAIYSKVILYIMRWFRNRLGEDACADNPDLAFLKDQYPDPENYEQFKLDDVSNINGFDFIDFETTFINDKKAWLVHLAEPDNGNERLDIQGRTFTTDISVYKQDKSVVLGIRESCREPEKNTIDAFGYRPGFVRDIFYDEDLLVTEQGLDKEYAFAHEAYKLNGKSNEACNRLYEGLIIASGRQMPILFVPGDYYEKHATEVDKKADSLLGYCHVVVWQNGCRKLFEQSMDNSEFVEVGEEGQLIFYRTNCLQEYPSAYFEDDSEDLLDNIKTIAQNEPLRKFCDFKEFSFKPSWWNGAPERNEGENENIEEIRSQYETVIASLTKTVNDLERDNDHLQRDKSALESENKKLDKEISKNFSDISRSNRERDDAILERDKAKEELQKLEEKSMREEMVAKGMISETKDRYKPIINLPPLSREKKEDILNWINEYYSDVLVIHPNAEKSLFSDNRNIDWHRFCMMIHYIAGYTRYRNEGGIALDPNAARDYDAEDSAYRVEPAGSGQGALEIHKDKYTITIEEKGEKQDVLLDLHLKYGKGMDDNMIRIYFHYSPDEKKSFIGYMPGHLPIR